MTAVSGEAGSALPLAPASPGDNRSQASLVRDLRLLALGAGHGTVDFCANVLPVFYPLLAGALGLNYGATSTLMTAQSASSAIGQPFFGWLADRFGTRLIASVSVLGAAAAIALVGFAPSYFTLLIVVAVLGLSVGAYHPQGAKAAAILGGRWRASSLSVYLILGNVGYSLGPLVGATLLVPMGVTSTAVVLIPAVLMAALLFANGGRVDRAVWKHAAKARLDARVPIPWLSVIALGGVIVARAWIESGLAAFLPLLYAARGEQAALAGETLFLAFLLQGPGTVAGGWLADRIGRKPTIIASFLLLAPAMKLFLDMHGASVLLMAPVIGILIGMSATITILAAQELMPSRMGVASGVATCLSTIMAGVGVATQGVMADRYGLEPVMGIIAAIALVAAVASAAIPKRR